MNEQTQALSDCLDLIGRMIDAGAPPPHDLDAVYDAGCAALTD